MLKLWPDSIKGYIEIIQHYNIIYKTHTGIVWDQTNIHVKLMYVFPHCIDKRNTYVLSVVNGGIPIHTPTLSFTGGFLLGCAAQFRFEANISEYEANIYSL
jgi:hypothetical protein